MLRWFVIGLLFVGSAEAAEHAIPVTTDPKDEKRLTLLAAESNRSTCENFTLPPTCTLAQIEAKHPHPDPKPTIYRDGWDYFVRALATPALNQAFERARGEESRMQARAFEKLTDEQRKALVP